MAQAVVIARSEMHEFLVSNGFVEVKVPGTKELVYSRVVAAGLCLRVYTTIEGDQSRPNGEDAIRTVLVIKIGDEVKIVGVDRRVHRVVGWRANLTQRLENWREQLGPVCPKCGLLTVLRRSGRGPFWGCSNYPVCKSVTPYVGKLTPVAPVAAPVHSVADDIAMKNDHQAWERACEARAFLNEFGLGRSDVSAEVARQLDTLTGDW